MHQYTEESPLIDAEASTTDPEVLKHDLLYQRFTPAQKQVIVALISWAAVIPCRALLLSSTGGHPG